MCRIILYYITLYITYLIYYLLRSLNSCSQPVASALLACNIYPSQSRHLRNHARAFIIILNIFLTRFDFKPSKNLLFFHFFILHPVLLGLSPSTTRCMQEPHLLQGPPRVQRYEPHHVQGSERISYLLTAADRKLLVRGVGRGIFCPLGENEIMRIRRVFLYCCSCCDFNGSVVVVSSDVIVLFDVVIISSSCRNRSSISIVIFIFTVIRIMIIVVSLLSLTMTLLLL